MITKQKGQIAEHAVSLQCLQRGWGVLKPVGDYQPYDLVIEIESAFVKLQVKYAWFDVNKENYVVDNRTTKTNRKNMLRQAYDEQDFDFAILYIEDKNIFYVMPFKAFARYGSEIHLVESDKRQRKPRSAKFREAWNLIEHWAASRETLK